MAVVFAGMVTSMPNGLVRYSQRKFLILTPPAQINVEKRIKVRSIVLITFKEVVNYSEWKYPLKLY